MPTLKGLSGCKIILYFDETSSVGRGDGACNDHKTSLKLNIHNNMVRETRTKAPARQT